MTSCQSHVHEPVASDYVPSSQQLTRTAALFKALGDPARLLLLYQLKDGERCVGELVVDGNKLSTVSARLQTLLNANLVKRRRDARHLYYRLADQHVVQLIDNALAHADEEVTMSD
nr:metalloregulator ArsR/SmtB family transcription factor [Halomonas sp.]